MGHRNLTGDLCCVRSKVGDLMRSMTLLAYKSMEGSLEEVESSLSSNRAVFN